jgi:aspartate kinase
MKVLKFGGSSLRDGTSMLRVGEIVAAEKEEKVVVVSAIQGITDSLLRFMSAVRKEEEVQVFVKELRERHLKILAEVASTMPVKQQAVAQLNARLVRLERTLYGITYLEELTPRTKDLVQSFGERMSVIVMSAMLQDMGVNAVPVEADELGIMTDGTFGSATVDMERTRVNAAPSIRDMFKRQEVPVVTGFFGKGPEGVITLLGRNGTDYSASVIANAIDADTLEIWKDVDGFMSADPKVVPGAVPIGYLSYEEAAELAYFGAKVLHPRTVEPARAKSITIRVKNVFKPHVEGSAIRPQGVENAQTVKSISFMSNMTMLKVYGAGLGSRSGVMLEISELLSNANVNIYSAATSQTGISLLIEERELKRAEKALAGAKRGVIDRIELVKDIALLCLVGEGLGTREGVAAKVFTIVASLGVNIQLISAGASTVALHFTVNGKDLEKTTRTIHQVFFEA